MSPLRPMPPRSRRRRGPACDTWLLVLSLMLIVGLGLFAVVTA